MTVAAHTENVKLLRVGLIAICLMQLFSAITVTAVRLHDGPIKSRADLLLLLVSIVASVSPILLVLLVRRFHPLVGLMAIFIVPIFLGRIYYTMLLIGSKYNFPKGDWTLWLSDFVALISVAIVVTWMFVRLSMIAIGLIRHAIRKLVGN
jgi:hypothetical protein